MPMAICGSNLWAGWDSKMQSKKQTSIKRVRKENK